MTDHFRRKGNNRQVAVGNPVSSNYLPLEIWQMIIAYLYTPVLCIRGDSLERWYYFPIHVTQVTFWYKVFPKLQMNMCYDHVPPTTRFSPYHHLDLADRVEYPCTQ